MGSRALIVVDSSALVAIVFRDVEADDFLRAIFEANPTHMSAVSLVETSIVTARSRHLDRRRLLDPLIEEAAIVIRPVTVEQAHLAREAYARFGKGNHPARLNLGDCFSYALAKDLRLPLLFKGDDFARTDVQPAV